MYPSAGGMHSSEDFGEDVEVGLEIGRPGFASRVNTSLEVV